MRVPLYRVFGHNLVVVQLLQFEIHARVAVASKHVGRVATLPSPDASHRKIETNAVPGP